MFKRILVPLDPTPLSEQALALAKRLLRREDAQLELMTVVVPMLEGQTEEGDEERLVSLRRNEARRRVDRVKESLEKAGVEVSSEVVMGDPAERILQRANSDDPPSLIAMATHGRSGPVRWIRGSVAERVLRRCNVPLLLCNPQEDAEAAKQRRFTKILVPLDGSETSAAIIPLAEEFARCHEAEIVLCRIGPLAASVMPYGEMIGPPIMLPALEEDLKPLVDRLEDEGLKVSTHVSLGDPANEILAAVDSLGVDLVAMTTHGHSGLDRWLFGSVAENVLRHCHVPVLVKRVRSLDSAKV